MRGMLVTEERVRAAIREVIDPELGVNVVDLGLIYGIDVNGGVVRVRMTLTTPSCPLHQSLGTAIAKAVALGVPGVERAEVELVWDPPWSPERITEEGRRALGWS